MTVARLTGLAPAEVGSHLAELDQDGLARYRDDRITGWALTGTGRAHHAERCAADVVDAGCRAVIEHGYRQFLSVNQTFLAVCTDWQMRDGPDGKRTLNDHTEAAYDAQVVSRLKEIDTTIQPVCDELTHAMTRFSGYAPRLTEALAKVEAGQQEWFTGALIDSYHTVWFELHEDLLATLGIARDSEGGR
jgi:hypothetical protein